MMTPTDASSYPYGAIVADLLKSVMKSQSSLLDAHFKGEDIKEDRFAGLVNKHFAWLALVYKKEGVNRHLFDGSDDLKPLRTAGLRQRVNMPSAIEQRLIRRVTPDEGLSAEEFAAIVDSVEKASKRASKKNNEKVRYWQEGGTRISELIRRAVEDDIRESEIRTEKAKQSGKKMEEFGFSIRSPLAIVFDLLTAPDMPGTRAYALMAVRNLLFIEFGLVPNHLHMDDAEATNSVTRSFGVRDIEEALSRTWTYLRPRYESQGDDKLTVGKADSVTLVRHFMAMKGVFRFRFGTRDGRKNCLGYLDRGILRGWESLVGGRSNRDELKFMLEKSEFLERLPETAELVNELLGLPIPIRGADTVFRGGLRFAARRGLVVALHGGPGTGKTSIALALGVYLAPFGIRTLFLSGEETAIDLRSRLYGLVPDGVRRLDFFPDKLEGDWITFQNPFDDTEVAEPSSSIDQLEVTFQSLQAALSETTHSAHEGHDGQCEFQIPKSCRAIIVFDGLHDLFANSSNGAASSNSGPSPLERLHEIVKIARGMEALVILTTGNDWVGDARLDYLVDMSIRLTHDAVDEYGSKPDRRLVLSKARHQLCATGTHGLQIAGAKGVRFSPQINYQLDRRSLWKVRLPDFKAIKKVLFKAVDGVDGIERIAPELLGRASNNLFIECPWSGAKIFRNSQIFINGQGSGGKAGLALKIAVAPSYDALTSEMINSREKVLVVSFLYPREYYEGLLNKLQGKGIQGKGVQHLEYGNVAKTLKPSRIEVIHLYPGQLKTNDLYNRIEWELDAAELNGDPYTCVIIDGIHNVFLQFPDIQRNGLFWPQIYNALRSRPIMTITTHTTLSVPRIVKSETPSPSVDDGRSVPLRHALVQKTDFQIEVDPAEENPDERISRLFKVQVVAAIGQSIPSGHVLWSRENMVFVGAESRPCTNCDGMSDNRESKEPCPISSNGF